MKNLFSILICCFLIIVFISCSKTPPDTPQLPPVNTDSSTFLIQLASSYPESGAGVMFHDINGKLLRYAAYNGSDTILFSTRDSLPGNKINITFFTPFDNGPNGKEYDLVSFLYNDMGQKWIVNDTNDNSGYMQTGTFQVNLFGINTDGQYNASDKEGYVFNDDNYHYETHTLNSTTTLVGNNTDYLVHYWDPGVQPGYIFLHNVRANSVYNLDIKDLKPYDHNLTIHFPKTQGIQYSVNNVTSPDNPNRGFILNGSFGSGAGNFDSAVSQLTLGYLDTFAVYHTFLSTSYDSVVYSYEGVGAAPASIDLPFSAHFTIANNTITNYQNSLGQNYLLRSSSWFYSNFPANPGEMILWNVFAPLGAEQHFLELPAEFATKYPDIKFSNLTFHDSQFFTTGHSYNDIVNAIFKQIPLPGKYENRSVMVYKR